MFLLETDIEQSSFRENCCWKVFREALASFNKFEILYAPISPSLSSCYRQGGQIKSKKDMGIVSFV